MSIDEINSLEKEIAGLEETLYKKKALLHQLRLKNALPCPYSDDLSSEEIVRYSRQMIMPQLTKSGQVALKTSKVLIVGAGGLGCPASMYLAAAGVGEIHVVDYDQVELSNLHRQILHYESDVGINKVQSVCNKLQSINGNIKVVPLHLHASSDLVDYLKTHNYNLVLDCSDNAPTRYLLNDICVFNNIPLVSGSALQMEGQLTVYHYKNGPCYRCLFPVPPPAHTVTNCGDGGVLGPVAGVVGVLQALEVIKILTGTEGVLAGRMLLFDGSDSVFRNVKLRERVASCLVCGDNPTITKPVDYEVFCGSKAHDKIIDIDLVKSSDHIRAEQLPEILGNNFVIDVRPEVEYNMCKLDYTINIPYSVITSNEGPSKLFELMKHERMQMMETKIVYFLCRRGNDSQRSVEYLQKQIPSPSIQFVNVKGGLHAYSTTVDPFFPRY